MTNETMSVTTPPPPIPLNQITFTITTPHNPLFLGTLHINAFPPAAGGVIGSVDPGGATAAAPAIHTFRMGAKFQMIRQFLINNQGPLAITITYDPITFLATDLNPLAMLMAANG
jgi:hypothetical protein